MPDVRRITTLVGIAILAACCGCATFGPGRGRKAAASITDETPGGESQVQQASYEETDYGTADLADEKDSSFWDSINPSAWSKSATDSYKKLTGQQPKPELARALYSQAEEKYQRAVSGPEEQRAALLTQAAAQYAEAAKRWPDSALEQDGLYMAGESYFFADAYVKANTMYEKLIKKYPGTKHMDTIDARRYTIAQYWLDITKENPEGWYELNYTNRRRPWRDTRGNALRVYDKIRIDDPSGKLADDATLAAGNAHFVSGNYFKADEYYGDLRKAFPSSEHQFKAHYLGLKTKLLCYQGSDYGGDALDEAEKLIKQIRKQFPKEASDEKEFLNRAFAEVRYKQAEREWDTAQYFIKRGEYGSARMYQQTILDKYSDTPFADRAAQQKADQAGEPDVPPKQFEWLVELFPREEPAKPWFYSDAPAAKK